MNMSSVIETPDTVAEFQRRRHAFARIASVWTGVLAAAAVLGVLLYASGATLRQHNGTLFSELAAAIGVLFAGAALRIHRAYERLFSCPRCGHPPQLNEVGVVLFLGWRARGMDPAICKVCGAKLK